jgi:hypothetical protein
MRGEVVAPSFNDGERYSLTNPLDKVHNFWYIDPNPYGCSHLKLKAGRKQDLADVEHLKMVLER